MQPQLIAGRYQVLRAIGRGGMGTVWLCRDEVLSREVAVKQIGALPGESATETRRAMREARSAAALNHPNVVAVYDVVNHDQRPWLVMEYVEGQTLADEISHEGQLSPQRVADIGAQLASALARAHERGIVHRDIKPANVLIDKAGRPKISDFGIARKHGDDQLTQTGFFTGTPGYLSPELARGGDPDWASDVWALGATLYAAVEGQPPYESRSNPIAMLMAIATEPPRPMTRAGALRPALAAMMHEDPARRWDMATSAQWLDRIARGDATAVLPGFDPAATQMIAAEPVGPTRRLEVPVPAIAGAVAAGAARPERAGRPDGDEVAVATPEGRKGQRYLWPLVFVSLLLAVLGVVYLLGQLGDQGGRVPALGATGRTTPAKTTATSAPETSAPPRTTSPPPRTSQPPSTTTAAPDPDPDADRRLEDFVEAYYSEVTGDTDRTWNQLAPRMKNAAGGREGYEDFWKTIDKVQVNRTTANASTTTAVANLTFTRDDGTTSNETHQLTFVTDGKDHLIESDQILG